MLPGQDSPAIPATAAEPTVPTEPATTVHTAWHTAAVCAAVATTGPAESTTMAELPAAYRTLAATSMATTAAPAELALAAEPAASPAEPSAVPATATIADATAPACPAAAAATITTTTITSHPAASLGAASGATRVALAARHTADSPDRRAARVRPVPQGATRACGPRRRRRADQTAL